MFSKSFFKALNCCCGEADAKDAGRSEGSTSSRVGLLHPEQATSSTALLAPPSQSTTTPPAASTPSFAAVLEGTSTSVATVESREQLGHHEDDSQTSVPRPNPPKDALKSLWDRAYEKLKDKNKGLVEKYEKVLSRELPKTSSTSNVLNSIPPDQVKESLDETNNRIDNANLQERRAQLDTIIKGGLQRMHEKKIKYRIAGHEYVLQDQIAQASQLVQWAKDWIGDAVADSPQASMAWAGVCVILPILTIPSAAEQANRDGFTYVTARMRFYVELERLLLLKNRDPATTGLEKEFEAHIVDLYQQILDFQFRSVLRFYRSRLENLGQDLIQPENWNAMLSKVQKLEKNVNDLSKKINTSVSRQALEKLRETANGSLETMKNLLSVAEQQLQVSEDSRDHLSEIAKFTGNMNKILTESRDADQAAIDLPTVENAPYNSAADEDIPLCHQGTRSGILKYITTWANDVTSETIFWLYGPAGTGKSTITRSLADSLAHDNQLRASYFFKRGEEDRNGTALFFPTIANQLVGTIPGFRAFLRKSLGKVKVENMALKEQFKRLILTPLSEMPTDKSGISTGVIIVDALDECEQYDRILKILGLLSQLRELSTVRLRVFLTSRPAIPIVDAFEELRSNGVAYRSLALHEEFYEDTKADISTFLKSRFATIKTKRKITDPWPDPTDLDRLVSLATYPSPLFIYAATLCRFVDDGKGIKRPTKQLKLWLEECDSNASQLNQIYVPILRQVLLGTDEEGENAAALDSEDRSQLLQILSAIVLLATPLPARYLAALLGIDEYDVNHWLRCLYAVLNVPSNPNAPVRLLHKSFADFLLGQEGTGTADLRVDAEKTHAILASKCIQRMKNGLSKDICSVRDPGKSRDKIDKAIIVHHIPPDLEYACLYWVYHLQHSGRRITDRDDVCTFLHTHFLHWLESLSWMRKISEGILAIASLETIALTSDCPRISSFIHDMKRFTLYIRSVIEQAPLQIYCSALIFAPVMSIVRKQFKDCKPRWMQRLPDVQREWGALLQTLEGHSGSVRSVVFSPDGKLVVSGSNDNTVRLWDAGTGALLQTLEGHSSEVSSVAFSPDGKLVASGSDDNTVRLWDAGTGTLLQTLKGHSSSVISVAFSPDGKLVASGSDDKTVKLWDAGTGSLLQTLEGHSSTVKSVVFSPDGKLVASSSWDMTVKLWDAGTGTLLQTLKGHSTVVSSVAFSPDGRLMASGSYDSTVKLWDAGTGTLLRTLEDDSSMVRSVAFSPDGKLVASGSDNNKVKLWDAGTGALLQTLKGHASMISSVAFSPDGKLVASGSWDNTVRLWDAGTGTLLQTPEGHSSYINSVVFSPDGKLVASGSYDSTVKLWDAGTGTLLQTLEGHSSMVTSVVFSPDGKLMASGSGDSTVRLWDAGTGALQQTLEGHSDFVSSVAFSPDGKLVASGSGDNTVRLWDAGTGTLLQTLEGHSNMATSVVFSPDGKLVTSGSDDTTVRLWDAGTGALLQALEGHWSSVSSVAFSPDGKLVASGSDDNIVRLWDAGTGTLLQMLEGHSSSVSSVAFSPDCKLVASGSWDNTVRLWDAGTGAPLQTLELNIVTKALSFSTSGHYLKTDRGVLNMSSLELSADFSEQVRTLFVSNDWVIEEGKGILLLPPDYRAIYVAVWNGVVVFGHSSGSISFLEFEQGLKTV